MAQRARIGDLGDAEEGLEWSVVVEGLDTAQQEAAAGKGAQGAEDRDLRIEAVVWVGARGKGGALVEALGQAELLEDGKGCAWAAVGGGFGGGAEFDVGALGAERMVFPHGT